MELGFVAREGQKVKKTLRTLKRKTKPS